MSRKGIAGRDRWSAAEHVEGRGSFPGGARDIWAAGLLVGTLATCDKPFTGLSCQVVIDRLKKEDLNLQLAHLSPT